MRIVVRRYQDGDSDAIDRLNRRLAAGESQHRLYKEDLSRNPHADLEVRPVNDSLFVAADGNEIRGGAWLREQLFRVDGSVHRVGWMKYPVSESLVDPLFAGVPASMVMQFIRQQPNLIALGMGGDTAPFARLLAGIGWKHSTIPLLVRAIRPTRVLRGLTFLRRRAQFRIAMNIAAWSGAGWLTHKLLGLAARRIPGFSDTSVTVEGDFTNWADPIWEAARDAYGAIAVRDAKALNVQYPSSIEHLQRLRVSRAGSDIGWLCAETLPREPEGTGRFGDLNVALITDVLAHPADASAVLAAGVKHLEAMDMDLVITYLSHSAWLAAAHRLYFVSGPSRFAFYRSPQAEQLLVADGTLESRCHFTRSGERIG